MEEEEEAVRHTRFTSTVDDLRGRMGTWETFEKGFQNTNEKHVKKQRKTKAQFDANICPSDL